MSLSSFPLDSFSLYKHYFVLTQRELLEKKATHPLNQLYGVTTREGRKDCNNNDSLAHRMRLAIKAEGEETLRLISVQECPLPARVVSVSRPCTCSRPSINTNTPMDWADKILLSHPLTPAFLVLRARYLDWQEKSVTPLEQQQQHFHFHKRWLL